MTQIDARPYGTGALVYRRKGWTDVFPVGNDAHPLAKSPVPKGVTGYDAPALAFTRIEAGVQLDRYARRNLGIRMPRQIVCLDVDQYAGHDGLTTLAAAEAELGVLPATYRNSARGWTESGHRYYRLPIGMIAKPGAEEELAKRYGPNIEVLHRGRRYAVAWPSLNPDHEYAPYLWYNPAGQPMAEPPAVVEIPLMPDAWAGLLGCMPDSPAATRSGGGNLRAQRQPDEDAEFWDVPSLTIRRSVAEARTLDQVSAVLAMTWGTVNKTLGGAGIWLARMANSGLLTLDQATEVLFAAAQRNGKHSDSWNAANRRRWTLESRITDALSQGLNRDPYMIIDDHPAIDVHAALMKRISR